MIEVPDPTTPGARFPWAVTAFACACVAAAVWTFMLFGYAWQVSPGDLPEATGWEDELNPPLCGYVEIGGITRTRPAAAGSVWLHGLQGDEAAIVAMSSVQRRSIMPGVPVKLKGRVTFQGGLSPIYIVDCTASRWNGASVAGLVVGAMGCLIFALHLRRWLRVRRLGVEARGVFTAEDAEDAERVERS